MAILREKVIKLMTSCLLIGILFGSNLFLKGMDRAVSSDASSSISHDDLHNVDQIRHNSGQGLNFLQKLKGQIFAGKIDKKQLIKVIYLMVIVAVPIIASMTIKNDKSDAEFIRFLEMRKNAMRIEEEKYRKRMLEENVDAETQTVQIIDTPDKDYETYQELRQLFLTKIGIIPDLCIPLLLRTHLSCFRFNTNYDLDHYMVNKEIMQIDRTDKILLNEETLDRLKNLDYWTDYTKLFKGPNEIFSNNMPITHLPAAGGIRAEYSISPQQITVKNYAKADEEQLATLLDTFAQALHLLRISVDRKIDLRFSLPEKDPNMPSNVEAMCEPSTTRIVSLNKNRWRSEQERIAILMHELGHCVLQKAIRRSLYHSNLECLNQMQQFADYWPHPCNIEVQADMISFLLLLSKVNNVHPLALIVTNGRQNHYYRLFSSNREKVKYSEGSLDSHPIDTSQHRTRILLMLYEELLKIEPLREILEVNRSASITA